MRKSTKQKAHKFIIDSITALCALVFFLALAGDARRMWVQVIVLIATGSWLYLWLWANGWISRKDDNKDV